MSRTGPEVAELRQELGMNLRDFATFVGVSEGTIRNIELGKPSNLLATINAKLDKLLATTIVNIVMRLSADDDLNDFARTEFDIKQEIGFYATRFKRRIDAHSGELELVMPGNSARKLIDAMNNRKVFTEHFVQLETYSQNKVVLSPFVRARQAIAGAMTGVACVALILAVVSLGVHRELQSDIRAIEESSRQISLEEHVAVSAIAKKESEGLFERLKTHYLTKEEVGEMFASETNARAQGLAALHADIESTLRGTDKLSRSLEKLSVKEQLAHARVGRLESTLQSSLLETNNAMVKSSSDLKESLKEYATLLARINLPEPSMTIGDIALYKTRSKAKSISSATDLNDALELESFLMTVGGVAFDKKAVFGEASQLDAVGLKYDPSKPDGERLRLEINGVSIPVRLPDWQLIPIARFADGDAVSCVSILGEMEDPEESMAIRALGGRVISYNPAFENTLLGLRLLQLDLLLLSADAAALPVKRSGSRQEQILGSSEVGTSIKDGTSAFHELQRSLEGFGWNSYVISDIDQAVTVDVGDAKGEIKLSGEPKYRFYALEGGTRRLPEVEAAVNERLANLKSVNPLVWDAGVTTMQYSALFRLIKEKFPAEWKAFITSIESVDPKPRIETPNVLYFPLEAERADE